MAPPLCVNTDWSSDTDGWAALSGRSPGGKSWLAASSPVASVPRVSQSPWLLVVPTDWEKGVCAEKSTKQRTLGHHLGWVFFFFFLCDQRNGSKKHCGSGWHQTGWAGHSGS